MTTRENDIRVSANATDPCPTDITGVSPDACSVITNASHADITNRIYAVPPTYTITEETLPTGLQSKLDSCLDGVCNFVSYDFETDTGTTAASLPYVINTRTTTTENSAVILKKRNVQLSSVTAQGTDVLVTTATPHNFMVGGTVSLSVTPFTGEFIIKSIPSSTTFTYENTIYTIPGQPITTSTNVTYTPPKPVELTAPSGYDFNTQAIVGTPIGSVITNASETTCATACDNNNSCIGFNFSSIGDTCQLFSSVTSNVVTSEASFRKENLTSNSGRAYIPEYIVSSCTNVKQCNDTMLKAINQGVSFSTTNINDCANCSPRSFKKQGTSFYVRNEFGTLSILTTIADAFSKISFSGDVIPLHVSSIQTYSDNFQMVDFKTGNVLFSFRFAASMTSRNNVKSYYTYNYNGIGLTDLNGTYITYQPGNNSAYKNSWYRLLEVPNVKNGYFIRGLQETYSTSGELTSRNDNYYFKYNNGFYADVNTPEMYSPYSDEYASFVFVIRSSCQPGYLFHYTKGCTICPENWYCPAGTIGNQMMIHCPYGTSSPTGSSDKSQCISCPIGDPGTTPVYNYTGRCVVKSCTSFDPNASSASPDTTGVCRVVCKAGYLRNSSGVCAPCSTTAVPGDPGTSGVYSDNCTLVSCTTTDPHASGATIDTTGACRNTCRYQKGSSGACTPCPGVGGDPGTTPLYLSTGCTVTACTTTTPNAYGAAPNTSGACITTCMPGFQKNSSGLCDACSVISGDPGTSVTYSEPDSCTPSSCTSTDPFATVGQTAYLDSTGACRNNCRNRYTRNSSGSCIPCASQNPNGDPYTSVAENPDWISSGGSCSFLCIVTLVNDSMIASITGARQDASGNCRVSCTRGYRRTTAGSCEVCPNSLPTVNDAGTTPFYRGYTGGNLYTDDANKRSCDVVCTTTDVNTFGVGYSTTDGCVNYCNTGFQRDFTNNQGGKCTACPVLTNVGGDPGTTMIYTASGSCSAMSCRTTEPNADGAEFGPNGSNCRNVCKPGYTRNSSGTCVTCTSLNDAGASATSYSSGCIAAACTTTDINASGAAPDAAGACRNTCKPGYTRDSTGKCTACNPPRDAGTTVITYSSGCIASACTTTDPNALSVSPDTAGVCRNTCKTGYQKNSLGTCVTCTNLGDSGTTPTAYLSGCFASTCTTTDTKASGAISDATGVCRNKCNNGFMRNSSGVCTACPVLRLVFIIRDDTNIWNQFYFYVQYPGTVNVTGKMIAMNNLMGKGYTSYWKILTQTGISFPSSWVTTYGLSSSSGTLCTVLPVDIKGNEVDYNPFINTFYSPSAGTITTYNTSYAINTDVAYCSFNYLNCPVSDPYTTPTYSSNTCNITQCTTTDSNVLSVVSDGSACRNTCKKNFERNTIGMCVPKPCQTIDPNSPGAELVDGSCRTMCNIGYSLNSSSTCQACSRQYYLLTIYPSSIYPNAVDGCYMVISSSINIIPGMVVHYSNTRFMVSNVGPADVSFWSSRNLIRSDTVGYGADVYAIDIYGNKISSPIGNSASMYLLKAVDICNSV